MRGWALNIEEVTNANTNFLEVIHTGEYSQVTLMSVEPGDDIGNHLHRDIDQLVRIEGGSGRLTLGSKRDRVEETHELEEDGPRSFRRGLGTTSSTQELSL